MDGCITCCADQLELAPNEDGVSGDIASADIDGDESVDLLASEPAEVRADEDDKFYNLMNQMLHGELSGRYIGIHMYTIAARPSRRTRRCTEESNFKTN